LTGLLAAAFVLSSCSRQKNATRDDLRSDLTAATSLATETQSFLDYVLQGRCTRHYAEGHLSYLADEAKHETEELARAVPEPGLEAQFEQTREQITILHEELENAAHAVPDPVALRQTRERIGSSRRALSQIQGSL
jgi:hypothetical protein